MAFNLSIHPTETAAVKAAIHKPTNRRFYIEWWEQGCEDTDIRQGKFSSKFINSFIQTFCKGDGRRVILLEQLKPFRKIVIDKRNTIPR